MRAHIGRIVPNLGGKKKTMRSEIGQSVMIANICSVTYKSNCKSIKPKNNKTNVESNRKVIWASSTNYHVENKKKDKRKP